jgi:hypothetical protein
MYSVVSTSGSDSAYYVSSSNPQISRAQKLDKKVQRICIGFEGIAVVQINCETEDLSSYNKRDSFRENLTGWFDRVLASSCLSTNYCSCLLSYQLCQLYCTRVSAQPLPVSVNQPWRPRINRRSWWLEDGIKPEKSKDAD